MPFFEGANHFVVNGGAFNDFKGDYRVADNRQYTTNVNSNNTKIKNSINSNNDNSYRSGYPMDPEEDEDRLVEPDSDSSSEDNEPTPNPMSPNSGLSYVSEDAATAAFTPPFGATHIPPVRAPTIPMHNAAFVQSPVQPPSQPVNHAPFRPEHEVHFQPNTNTPASPPPAVSGSEGFQMPLKKEKKKGLFSRLHIGKKKKS